MEALRQLAGAVASEDAIMKASNSNFAGVELANMHQEPMSHKKAQQTFSHHLLPLGARKGVAPEIDLVGLNASCPNQGDTAALQLLVDGLQGIPPPQPNSSCCAWQIVVCDSSGNVTGVVLRTISARNEITGTLPNSTRFRMQHLTVLDLSASSISGTLPPGLLGALPALEQLLLTVTFVNGTLPAPWGTTASNLRILDLSGTQIAGTLPPEWGSMGHLEQLSLSETQLVGTLPSEWSGMQSLSTLHLGQTLLEGHLPAAWGHLTSLVELLLFRTDLDGTLPAEWAGMKSLVTLDAHETDIEGTLPREWGALTSLSVLVLTDTMIEGQLPSEWSGMTSMFAMMLENNFLSGDLPSAWGAMPSLQQLSLSNTMINGTLPAEWSNMSKLMNIDLHLSPLSGTLPPEWANMSSINNLVLHDTLISGTLPREWGSMPVRTISLQNTNITGTLPPEWGGMNQITVLQLYQTQIAGTLPAEWGNGTGMKSLYTIMMYRTALSGTLPPEWGGLSNLAQLHLYQTQIEGTLPASWAALLELETLYLFQTLISGGIPSEWASPVFSLSTLLLGSCRLSGDLQQLQLPPMLEVLDLSGNMMSGTVPCWPHVVEAYLEGNSAIAGIDPTCVYSRLKFLSIASTNVAELPWNLSAVLPSVTYVCGRNLPKLQLLPQPADNAGLQLDFGENSLILSELNISLSSVKFLDFTPARDYHSPVNFGDMCKGTCRPLGPYTASDSQQPPPMQLVCTPEQLQQFVNFDRNSFHVGNYSSPVMISMISMSTSQEFVDLSSPIILNAVLIPSLQVTSPTVFPAFATRVTLPSWQSAPIAFSQYHRTLSFAGLGDAQMLHGVEYSLTLLTIVDGTASSVACKKFPFLYSFSIGPLLVRSCDAGLVGANFTQQCVSCPYNARCSGTKIFAAANAAVWRPSLDLLPFYSCFSGSRGCLGTTAPGADSNDTGGLRVGMECAPGYEGPLCGVCSTGYGRTSNSNCAECYTSPVNVVVVAAVVLFALGIVTFTAMQAAAPDTSESSVGWRPTAMSAVRLFTNHFSLFGILAHTEISTALSESVKQMLEAQNAASSPSPLQNSFFSCLLPYWTYNEDFLILALLVPALIAAEVLLAGVRYKFFAFASVSAAVLQLCYMQVMQVASKILRHRPLLFYESTPYLTSTGQEDRPAVVVSFDLLEADARIDFSKNDGYFAFAWTALILFGLGVPLWFIGAYHRIQKQESTAAAHRKLRFLVRNYREGCWFWETVVTVRKGLAVVIVGALAPFPVLQLQAISILYMVYSIVHEYWLPFSTDARTMAERASCGSAIFTVNALLASYTIGTQHRAADVSFAVVTLAVQLSAVAVLVRIVFLDIVELRRKSRRSCGARRPGEIGVTAADMEDANVVETEEFAEVGCAHEQRLLKEKVDDAGAAPSLEVNCDC
jgi:hypothetical protein